MGTKIREFALITWRGVLVFSRPRRSDSQLKESGDNQQKAADEPEASQGATGSRSVHAIQREDTPAGGGSKQGAGPGWVKTEAQ